MRRRLALASSPSSLISGACAPSAAAVLDRGERGKVGDVVLDRRIIQVDAADLLGGGEVAGETIGERQVLAVPRLGARFAHHLPQERDGLGALPGKRQREAEVVAQQQAVRRGLETGAVSRLRRLVLTGEVVGHAEPVSRLDVAGLLLEHRLVVNDRHLRPIQADEGPGIAPVRGGACGIPLERALEHLRGIIVRTDVDQRVAQQEIRLGPAAFDRDRLLIELHGGAGSPEARVDEAMRSSVP
jgi:hypothetical protein